MIVKGLAPRALAASNIWWTGLFPGLAIVLLVVGLTLLGEGLSETTNPVLRKRPIMAVDLDAPSVSGTEES